MYRLVEVWDQGNGQAYKGEGERAVASLGDHVFLDLLHGYLLLLCR